MEIQDQNAYDEAYYQGLENDDEDFLNDDNDDKKEVGFHHVNLFSNKNRRSFFIFRMEI